VGNDFDRFVVVTGGPGSGKTTLIDALEEAGFARTIEAGRGIIQDQVAIGGRALPWIDPALFAEHMLTWEMRSYHAAKRSQGWMFFDRGVPDVAGYLRLMRLPIPHHVEEAVRAFRYHPRVLIAPPWGEIFEQDGERKQDFAEAVRTFESLTSAYSDFGYELVEIPRCSVKQRVEFVLETIGVRD
jgi:predicted ATPase